MESWRLPEPSNETNWLLSMKRNSLESVLAQGVQKQRDKLKLAAPSRTRRRT